MNLHFDLKLAEGYTSNSQIARILTEKWVKKNSFCPNCGESSLDEFEKNRPVADFFCKNCSEEFELKSKKGGLANKIVDGAYSTMIHRINSDNNPNFFFLTYSKLWSVNNFLIIPKHFFTPEIIIERKPLPETARRAGWVGCNIDISKIPDSGKVFIVRDAKPVDKSIVKESFSKMIFLRETDNESKGWLLDLMNCLDSIHKDSFSLKEVYQFEENLKIKHPKSNTVKDKIRQKLQVLRDKGIIEFTSRGNYKKLLK